MPRFEGKEARIRGFNGNKIVFGPGDGPKMVSAEEFDWLKKDQSFIECVRKGWIVDIDGAMGMNLAAQLQPAPTTNAPSVNLPTILLQIGGLQDVESIRNFALGIPTTLDADGRKQVEVALAERLKTVNQAVEDKKHKK